MIKSHPWVIIYLQQLGVSDIMDQDDFVHFMICLNSTP